jgi:hypothetical protein
MLVLRVAMVRALPDADSDAYGHWAIARAMRATPLDASLHWVWLPGWHVVLAAARELGVGFGAVRLVDACIAAIGPIVLHAALRRSSPRAALLAAIAWALCPLTNLLATSAQSETAFALALVVGGTSLARRRSLVAAAALAAACLLRYEAWAAVIGVGVGAIAARRPLRATVLTIAPPVAVTIAWVVLRAARDGSWLAFFHDTVGFVGGTTHGAGLRGLFVYTAVVPLKVLGPVALLAALGIRRAARAVPELAGASAGVLVFVTAASVLGGSFALDRHFAALAPFTCVAIGFAASRTSPPIARASLVALAVALMVHVAWFASRTRERWAPQMAAAEWIDAHAGSATIVCDDVALEVLTHLPEARFSRALPRGARAIVYGWESRLGVLAAEGTLAGRWSDGAADGPAVVVRVVSADR